MRWTWDPVKAAENIRKHGVSFPVAIRVFDDSYAVTYPDPFEDEERWRTVGRPTVISNLTLFVVHTWPESAAEDEEQEGRIISARKAEPREVRDYENGKHAAFDPGNGG